MHRVSVLMNLRICESFTICFGKSNIFTGCIFLIKLQLTIWSAVLQNKSWHSPGMCYYLLCAWCLVSGPSYRLSAVATVHLFSPARTLGAFHSILRSLKVFD